MYYSKCITLNLVISQHCILQCDVLHTTKDELLTEHGLGLDIGLQTENCRVGKIIIFLKKSTNSDFFDLNQIFGFILEICIFTPRFYQIFELGLSAQSHKQHGHHASAHSGYTLAEQKSK